MTASSESNRKVVPLLCGREGTRSFGDNLSTPYIPYYLMRLQATASQMGIFRALQSVLPNIFQLPWGYLSDRMGRRIIFIVIGGVLMSITLFSSIFVSDVTLLILIFSVNAIGYSMMIPTYSALLGDRIEHGRRGREFSRIVNYALAAGVFANLFVLFYFSITPPEDVNAYRTLFIISSGIGLASIVFLLPIRETNVTPERIKLITPSKFIPEFKYLIRVQGIYTFFMSLSWPLFYFTMVDVLGAKNAEIAIVSLLGAVSTIGFQKVVGMVLDRAGPVGLIIGSRFLFVIVPLGYGLATSVYHIYILTLILGLGMAIVNVAFNAYILDISSEETRGEYFAYFNLVSGVAGFTGSILGGYLASWLGGIYPVATALLIIYIVSGIGRFSSACMFFKLKGVKKYPSTTRQVAGEVLSRLRNLFGE